MRICDIHHRSRPAVNGQANVLALGCFREGLISEISVVQAGGTAVSFSYEIYTCLAACPPGTSATDDPTTPQDEGVAKPDLYKLNTASVTGTSGGIGRFAPANPVPFRNADGGGGMTRAKGRIYLVLTPAGSGPSTWDVRISGKTIQN